MCIHVHGYMGVWVHVYICMVIMHSRPFSSCVCIAVVYSYTQAKHTLTLSMPNRNYHTKTTLNKQIITSEILSTGTWSEYTHMYLSVL